MKSLIIEDNKGYVNELSELLSSITNKVEIANNGLEGVYMAESESYDLIVMDALLPKLNGIEVLKKIREKSICPIVIVSVLDDVEKRVEMLNLGADDYIVRPYDDRELKARIISILRRFNNNFYEIYKHKNLTLDYRRKMFCVGEKYVKLSGKIYEVLEFLIRNRNIIVPKEQLFNSVWGMDSDTIVTVTEVYVCKLRNILKKYGEERYLKTIKNVGYIWEDTPQE